MSSQHYRYGLHSVEALLEKSAQDIRKLFILKERSDKRVKKIIDIATKMHIPIEYSDRKAFDHLAGNAAHQGVIALCKAPEMLGENDLPKLLDEVKAPLLLILDGVQDPHNLGACLRSAECAGVTAVIAPRDKAVGLTPTVIKVASGAAEVVPFIQVTNLARTMEMLKERGVWMYGTCGEATKTIYETDLKGAIAIVMGSEGEGMRRLTRDKCDGVMMIPMMGSVSSLNVSVATGVCLFEALRQRGAKGR